MRLAHFYRRQDFQLREALAAKLYILKVAYRIVKAEIEIEGVAVEMIGEGNLLHAKLKRLFTHGDHRYLAVKAVIGVDVIIVQAH